MPCPKANTHAKARKIISPCRTAMLIQVLTCCGGFACCLDSKREQVGRVAADSDDPGSRMRADDRPQRLDHQGVGNRSQLAGDTFCVRLCVSVAHDYTHALSAVQLARQLDDA